MCRRPGSVTATFIGAGRVGFRHAMRGERREDAVDVEAFDSEAEVVDARRGGPGRPNRNELRPGPDTQDRVLVRRAPESAGRTGSR